MTQALADDFLGAAQRALRTRLLEVEDLPAARAWQNQAFDPPAADSGAMWVEEHMLLGPMDRAAVGTTLFRARHLYQVSLRIGARQGTRELLTLAAKVANAFLNRPLPLDPPADGSTVLTVWSAEPNTPLQEPDWWHLPISITYSYDVQH